MESDWTLRRLADLIEIRHGWAFQGRYFRDEPTPWVLLTPGNFAVGGGFRFDKVKYYDGPVPDEFVLEPGDLLVVMTDLSREGDLLGYPAMVPATPGVRYLHNQRLGKIVIRDGAPVDKWFLYYVLCTADYRHEVLASVTGTTVKHTSPTRVLAYETEWPSPDEQCAVSGLLKALDEKIELNRGTNRTLETIVEALFKSWFVDFDPVVAKAQGRHPTAMSAEIAALFPRSFSETGSGPLPQGWRVGALGELAENPRRGVDPGKVHPATPYIGLEHMPRRSIALTEWGTASHVLSGKTEFHRGEVLFGKLRPYFHKVGVAPTGGVCSTDVLVIAPKDDVWFGLLLGHVSSTDFVNFADASSVGTKMPRARWQDLARYEVVIPPREIAAIFSTLVRDCVERILHDIHESRALVRARETLLPSLLSGEIRLGEAEKLVEQAV